MDHQRLRHIEKVYGIRIIPARIIGRRWSFYGDTYTDIPVSYPLRVQISETHGFVIYNGDNLSEQDLQTVKQFMKENFTKK